MRLIAITGLALALLLPGCKKDKDDDPCERMNPTITPLQGGVGTSAVALDSVPHNTIPVHLNCSAGFVLGYYDARVNMVSVRLIATGSDSVMFAEDTIPNTPNTDYFIYVRTLGTDSLTAPLAARLRVTATNTCGHSKDVLYDMVLMPD